MRGCCGFLYGLKPAVSTDVLMKRPHNSVKVIIQSGDDEPRQFDLIPSGTAEETRRAIDAGVAWFNVAFAESMRRARESREPEPRAA